MGAAIYEIKGLNLENLARESPLDQWFYKVVQKQVSQLDLLDISRMLRQEVFLDIAIPVTEQFLLKNPLCGEMYDGQLMELLVRVLEAHPEERYKVRYQMLKERILPDIDWYITTGDIDGEDFKRMLSRLFAESAFIGKQK